MKKWIDRSPREQAVINGIGMALMPVAWLFLAVGAVAVIGAALWWVYIVGAVAWSLVP